MPPLPDPNIVISRFKLSGRSFYFFSKWETNQFELHITDGKHVWFGKGTTWQKNSGIHTNSDLFLFRIPANEKEIEEKLKPKEMGMDEYLKLTREALTTQDVSKTKYSYSIQQGNTLSQIIVPDSLIK
jgi:hypothetical protein